MTDWSDATGWGAVVTVLQQGCCPTPMWQSPAIFLQHAISAAVICTLGKQASAGVARKKATKHNAKTDRQHAMTRCYPRQLVSASRSGLQNRPFTHRASSAREDKRTCGTYVSADVGAALYRRRGSAQVRCRCERHGCASAASCGRAKRAILRERHWPSAGTAKTRHVLGLSMVG